MKPGRSILRKTLARFPESAAAISLVGICIVFTVLNRRFLTVTTWGEILATAAELGIIAIPLTMLIIGGDFDLSVGSVYAASATVFVACLRMGMPTLLAFALTVVFGGLMGLINGLIVVKVEIHSFIVTLGMMLFLRGVLYVVTGGFPLELARGSTDTVFGLIATRIGGTPIRVSSIWFLVVVGIFTFIASNTRHGNWNLATGGDRASARDEGVAVDKVRLTNFVSVGCFTAVSGVILVGRMYSVFPTAGFQFEMEAIASAVMGGCLLGGGMGTIIGSFVGVLLMSSMRIGLVLAGAPAYWYLAFTGLLVVIAVVVREKVKLL